MGYMLDGTWNPNDFIATSDSGEFKRKASAFREEVEDASGARFQPEAGRYHLYVSYACPWAHRTLIVRALRKLEDVISVSVVDAFMGDEGWTFGREEGSLPEPHFGAPDLKSIYLKADPQYTGRVTVPVLWDTKHNTIVNNESAEIVRMFDTVFADAGLGDSDVRFYDAHRFSDALKSRIDETIKAIYNPINNGVYRAGFAKKQGAYDAAVKELFEALDHWDDVLGHQRYLCGDRITEADWFMFTTLIRFDKVYNTHFKCNTRRIIDYPNLWPYLRELYQIPGVAETCNFDHIVNHYYTSHTSINPYGLVPSGPRDMDLSLPHGRG